MLALSLIYITPFISSVLGAALIVPNSNCTDVQKGSLSLNSAALKNIQFSLDSGANLKYAQGSGTGLKVVFQTCTPNFGKYSNDGNGASAGHIYVPALDSCLGISSPQSDPPYTVQAVECETIDDSRQIFINWVKNEGGLFWGGLTTADGTRRQANSTCGDSGLFGFNSKGISATGGDVQLICQSDNSTIGFAITS